MANLTLDELRGFLTFLIREQGAELCRAHAGAAAAPRVAELLDALRRAVLAAVVNQLAGLWLPLALAVTPA